MSQDIYDVIKAVQNTMEAFVDEGTKVEAEELGLDDRASYGQLIIDPNGWSIIASGSDVRVLEYYGGFEYVDNEHKKVVGSYTIYMADDNRVREAIDFYQDNKEEAA